MMKKGLRPVNRGLGHLGGGLFERCLMKKGLRLVRVQEVLAVVAGSNVALMKKGLRLGGRWPLFR